MLSILTVLFIEIWFKELDRDMGDVFENSYKKPEGMKKTIVAHLKDIFIAQGSMAPYSGPRQEPLRLARAGPNIFFVDLGHLEGERCGRILCGSTDGMVREILTNLRLPYALSIHLASKRIFWSDVAEGTISSCDFSGKSTRIIVREDDGSSPKQVVIDQVDSKVYWTQSESTEIMRCDLDGTHIECVIEVDADDAVISSAPKIIPNGITLDQSRRHVYWSQPSPKTPDKNLIRRAPMNRTCNSPPSCRDDVETLFEDLPQVLDIDFVPVFDEIYWSVRDGPTARIHRGYVGTCPDYGMAKQNLVVQDLRGLGWLKVDPKCGHFYSTSVMGTINRYDMATGDGELNLFHDRKGAFAGIGFMEGLLEWEGDGWCDQVSSDESNEDPDTSDYKKGGGRVIGMDGANDINSESTGTLSSGTLSSGSSEEDTNVIEDQSLTIRTVAPGGDSTEKKVES